MVVSGGGGRGEHDDFFVFGFLLSLLVRWMVAIYPYSGASMSPMFGDYEAQRHWMEICVNTPTSEWYYDTKDNRLDYWGLDYPPLTAYHSWLNGIAARQLNASWVELYLSRGLESYDHKLFMRYSVFVCDLLIYVPAVIAYWKKTIQVPQRTTRDRALAIVVTLLYPSLYLVDYGHFQYNNVSLGLMLWAVVFLASDRQLVASIFFVLALSYKQMELYHALPFFFYLLGKSLKLGNKIDRFMALAKLGAVVILTCLVVFLPFLTHLPQVLHRLFPFARGIFEDKVASFWCSLNVVIKIKNIFDLSRLALFSGILTMVASFPSSVHLAFNPSLKSFKLSLVVVSLSFFLFSYHVHEKSILLVAIPTCLLIDEYPVSSIWFLLLSQFSMFPLLLKDGLSVPYFTLFFVYLIGCYSAYLSSYFDSTKKMATLAITTSLVGALVLSLAAIFVEPPGRYPDLHAVLISLYSFVHFAFFFLYFNYLQLFGRKSTFTKLKTR